MAKTKKEETVDTREVVIALLKKKVAALFDKEPTSGFAGNQVEKLADEIVNLFN